MMIPVRTATAKLCVMMVMAVTKMMMKTSVFGILFKILKLDHLKVKNATTIITPVSAAIGIFSIIGAAIRIIIRIARAAITPETLLLEPALRFTRVCAIIGQPPIPEKKPFRMLEAPCARLSLEPFPLVSVISSTRFRVKSPSVSPTAATIAPAGRIIIKVSQVKGTFGI